MLTGLTTPGTKTSEFLLTILNGIAQLVLAITNTLTPQDAAKYGVAGMIAYAIARGLAKYETTSTAPPKPPVA